MNNGLLLDTHSWIWLVNGDLTLSKPTLKMLDAACMSNSIYVSTISMWEIGMLTNKKRIILNQPTLDWIEDAIQKPNLNLIPLSPHITVESCHLPGVFHGDPADRLIIATARIENLTLITRDKKILQYGQKKYVKILKA